jgi:signal peptidase I
VTDTLVPPAAPAAPPAARHARRRNPWLAAAASYLVPPLGHVYAGRAARGFAAWLAALALGTASLAASMVVQVPALRVALVVMVFSANLVVAADAWRAASQAPVPFVPRRYNRVWVYLVLAVGLIAAGNVVFVSLKAKVGRAFKIASGTMMPALRTGDMIMVAPVRGTIRGGEVIAYEAAGAGTESRLYRVAGLPGDTLEMRAGRLSVNGRPLREPYAVRTPPVYVPPGDMEWQRDAYVGGDPASYAPTMDDWGPLRIPDGTYFVLGDNRGEAIDSRVAGPVDEANVIGRAVWIYFSYDRATGEIRWSRIGRAVR